MDGQIKKGILEMCILFQLSTVEMYGYEIMKIIRQAFPDIHEATIYCILRRLHREGYTQTYVGNVSNGPQRKYYKITSLGVTYLADSIVEWKSVLSAVNMIGIE